MRPLGLHLGMSKKSGGDTPAYWGLCFTAEEDGSVVAMQANGSAPTVTLETSFDGEAWEPFYVGETTITLNRGERVYFKAGEGGNTAFATSTSAYNKFVLTTGKIAASGNVMSLLNGSEDIDTLTTSFCLSGLFQRCTSLTAAPELPATTLTRNCYWAMFYGCTSLTTAPELPAETLEIQCYNQMFQGCTSLITAPELPATTLASSCYAYMFRDCTSLTTAPELPAETLESNCYFEMFRGCASLTTAPELPATTLVTACYSQMFYGCEKLNELEVAFAVFADTTNWLSGVPSTGTFYCPSALGTNETITRGASACPEGWTVVNTD